MKMSNSMNSTRPLLLIACGVILGGGALYAFQRGSNLNQGKSYQPNQLRQASFQPSSDAKLSQLNALDSMFTELTEFTSEAVVHIQVRPDQQGRASNVMAGDGSGLIIDPNGWIVTNDHVVNNSESVDVILADGQTVKGKVTTI